MKKSAFDPAISFRTSLTGAVIGWLSARYGVLDEPTASVVGFIVGFLYDRLAFEVKSRWPALEAGERD